MLLPSVILVLIFSYIPLYGLVIAFQDFIPAKGLFGQQKWVGLSNFRFIIAQPDSLQVLINTLSIASMKIVFGMGASILFALLLNEVSSSKYRRICQTMIYFPYFISWVLIAGTLKDILSPGDGIVNKIISLVGGRSIYFLGDPKLFQGTMVLSDVWKNFGYNTVIYLAAITSIDPQLYEAAKMDGANKRQEIRFVTIPGMVPIIILMLTLSLSNVLNAGFDQIFNMYSPQVYSTGDIIDTYVYRIGLIGGQFSFGTAVGLMKSFVSSLLVGISYYLAFRYSDYRIF